MELWKRPTQLRYRRRRTFDGLEAGIPAPTPDTDLVTCFVADEDPNTQTSPILLDTDGGGTSDSEEDRNQNGALDDWETDPTS